MSVRIVVADDEADIRPLVACPLRRHAYTVLEATDGEQALQLILVEQPDLAVLGLRRSLNDNVSEMPLSLYPMLQV